MTAWITRDELAGHVGRDLAFHPVASLYLEAACQCIREYTDQVFDYVANDTIFVRGSGTNMMILPQAPVIAVASVTIDDSDTVEDPTTYEIQGRSGLARIDGNRWPRESRIEVVYSHGYVFTEDEVDSETGTRLIPATLRIRALEVATVGLSAGTTGVGGVRSETIGRYQYEMQTDSSSVKVGLTEDQEYDLYSYRIEDVA